MRFVNARSGKQNLPSFAQSVGTITAAGASAADFASVSAIGSAAGATDGSGAEGVAGFSV
jgi:hypothetical protein